MKINFGKKFIYFLKKETVFSISAALAITLAFFVPISKDYLYYPDYRVLALLFSLMLIVAGVRKQGVFHLLGAKLTSKVKGSHGLTFVLEFLCFFSSMLITNDVALLTFVPFSLELLNKKWIPSKMIRLIVLETIAANLGSMLTPVGNPQNLYLFSRAGVSITTFLIWMLPLAGVSFVLLTVTCFLGKNEKLTLFTEQRKDNPDKKKLGILLLLFLLCIGTVIRIIPWQVSFIFVLVISLWVFRDLLGEVDYFLLGTFLCFFVFVGNIQNIHEVSNFIAGILKGRELIISVIASQIISNVPAAMLLSGFTNEYKELVYGVDIGGLGTLIASLASLISYKFYSNSEGARKGRFLLLFTVWNILFLVLLFLLALFLL